MRPDNTQTGTSINKVILVFELLKYFLQGQMHDQLWNDSTGSLLSSFDYVFTTEDSSQDGT